MPFRYTSVQTCEDAVAFFNATVSYFNLFLVGLFNVCMRVLVTATVSLPFKSSGLSSQSACRVW